MGTRLKVHSDYAMRELHYTRGEVIDVSDDLARWLLADAPDCFEVYSELPAKAVSAPPVDKMMRSPKVKK